MKKIYMTPVAEEIKLNYQFSLLANSVFNVDDDTSIIENDGSGSIIDISGGLDPDAHELFDIDDNFDI